MTMPLYGRRLVVTIGDRIFTDHRIDIDISRDSSSSQDSGHVKLYNIGRDNERHLDEHGTEITVEGGYESQTGILFNGQAQRIRHPRQIQSGVQRITHIKLGDFAHAPAAVRGISTLGGTTSRSYEGPQSLRALVTDLATDLGLPVGPLDAIPPSAQVADFSWTGSTTDALTVLCRQAKCGWYEDDGRLRFRRQGDASQPDRLRLLIGPDSGLVNAPEETDEGIRITTLLSPHIVRGTFIRVEADEHYGDYTVVKYQHRGSNWEGDFHTISELRAA